MKQILLLALFGLLTTAGIAQFGTAHDFTVEDIEGNEHNLYSILDEGKVVVLDVSTTWCGPCWDVHQAHYMQDLHTAYGPDGTDQIRVIFYEGDGGTGMNALNGTGGNTLGDWVTGTDYAIINESPLQLDLNVYAPQGFPTISVIRPSDREITHDVWDQNLQQMINAINTIITLDDPAAVSNKIVEADLMPMEILPNPASDFVQMNFSNEYNDELILEVFNTVGQLVHSANISGTQSEHDLTNWTAGAYIAVLKQEDQIISRDRFMKL